MLLNVLFITVLTYSYSTFLSLHLFRLILCISLKFFDEHIYESFFNYFLSLFFVSPSFFFIFYFLFVYRYTLCIPVLFLTHKQNNKIDVDLCFHQNRKDGIFRYPFNSLHLVLVLASNIGARTFTFYTSYNLYIMLFP